MQTDLSATISAPGLTPIDYRGHRASILYPASLLLRTSQPVTPSPSPIQVGQKLAPHANPLLSQASPGIPAAISPMQASLPDVQPAGFVALTPTGPLPPLPQPFHLSLAYRNNDGTTNLTGKLLAETCKQRAVPRSDLANWMLSLGIDANRLTCPSLSAQFAIAEASPIQKLICSCLPGDGRTSISDTLAHVFPAEVLAGCLYISHSFGLPITIAVDSARPPTTLLQLARGTTARIASTPSTYPAADPILLTLSHSSARLRPGSSPAAAGLIFLDAAAAFDIGSRVLNLTPSLVPTVAYLADSPPQIVFVPRATPILAFIAALPAADAPLASSDPCAEQIFLDDLPRNLHPTHTHTIDTASRTLHIRPPSLRRPPQPCVQCGWCAEVCPTRMRPALLLDAVQSLPASPAHSDKVAATAGLHACIECGLCNYICPSALDLLAAVRQLRKVN